VPVTITGVNFIPTPAAMLGTSVFITISAATTDTLTGTVPAGLVPGVYALTVRNADGRSGTLSPAYTAFNPPSLDTTLETGYLLTFGPGAPGTDGDDDHVQVIFFEVPASCSDSLYFRIFDADTGGAVDELHGGGTTIMYTLRGYTGTYAHFDARSAHPGPAGINSGTLLTQTVIGDNSAYDNNWALVFGPYSAAQGESVGSSKVFKLVVEGISGNDGNLYNVVLSADPLMNVAPAESRVFAYSWTFPLALDPSQRPPLYPYVSQGTAFLEQHNWDMDYAGGEVTLHTPMRNIGVLGSYISGDGEEAWSSYGVQAGEDGTTWTVTMEFSPSGAASWNDVTFWTAGDGADLAIFTRPTMASPP